MISLNNITVQRQGNALLKDLSLTLRRGEHTAIIGPNGAGKSTLLKVLTKEMHPLQQPGMEVRLFGETSWDVQHLRSRLGIVTPDLQRMCHTPYPVREVVLSGYFSSIGIFHRQHRISRRMEESMEQALELLEITRYRNTPMYRLSSGEARRVLIARALVTNPEMLILDEPSDNLDLKAQKTLRSALEHLIDNGKTLVITTHDLADVLPAMDRILYMQDGRIIADGKKDALFTRDQLSLLYGTEVHVDSQEGFYKVWV